MSQLPDQPNRPTDLKSLRGDFTPFQRRALARMAVEGIWSRKQMAAVLRTTPPTVDRYLDQDPETQEYLTEYEAVAVAGLVDTRWRLLGMVDQALLTIKDELTGPDPRTRHDSAWRVIESVLPKGGVASTYARQPGDPADFDPQGRQVVIEAMVGLAKVVASVQSSEAFTGSAMRSIKTGPEALPGPGVGRPNGGEPVVLDADPDQSTD